MWTTDVWIYEVPAWERVRVFHVCMHQLATMFQTTLVPEGARVPLSFSGTSVQRQPVLRSLLAKTSSMPEMWVFYGVVSSTYKPQWGWLEPLHA